MHLVRGGRGAAVFLHPAVEPFQVLGPQVLDPVGAQPGDEVPVDGHPVAGEGVLSHGRTSDVLHPVSEPGLHRPAWPALRTVPLSRSRSKSRTFLITAASVLPRTCRRSVVLHPDGHPATPGTVSTEVDTRCSVGSTSHPSGSFRQADAYATKRSTGDSTALIWRDVDGGSVGRRWRP